MKKNTSSGEDLKPVRDNRSVIASDADDPPGFSDPQSPNFLQGASFERRARILKALAPRRYEGLEMMLRICLEDSFAAIGPNPGDYSGPKGWA